MKQTLLNLMDLAPKEATFDLSGAEGGPITLCRWSLRVRAWALERFGSPQALQSVFSDQKINDIADLAFFMLKDKARFTSKDAFLDAVVTVQDQLNLIKALLYTIGIGEPEIEKLNQAAEAVSGPKGQAPSPPIGAKSTTP